jgi:hypothetical protein
LPLYVAVCGGLASVLLLVAALAGVYASADEYGGRPPGGERVGLRARLAARLAAHPLAFGLQIGCLAGACAVMPVWLAHVF